MHVPSVLKQFVLKSPCLVSLLLCHLSGSLVLSTSLQSVNPSLSLITQSTHFCVQHISSCLLQDGHAGDGRFPFPSGGMAPSPWTPGMTSDSGVQSSLSLPAMALKEGLVTPKNSPKTGMSTPPQQLDEQSRGIAALPCDMKPPQCSDVGCGGVGSVSDMGTKTPGSILARPSSLKTGSHADKGIGGQSTQTVVGQQPREQEVPKVKFAEAVAEAPADTQLSDAGQSQDGGSGGDSKKRRRAEAGYCVISLLPSSASPHSCS